MVGAGPAIDAGPQRDGQQTLVARFDRARVADVEVGRLERGDESVGPQAETPVILMTGGALP